MHKRLGMALLMSLLFMGFVASCKEEEAPAVRARQVTFIAGLTVSEDQEVIIDLGIDNGSQPLPADETFNGRWEVTNAEGEPRAAADVHELDSVPGGAEQVIFTWSGRLEPGTHELVWGAPGYGGTIVEFEVIEEEEGRLRLGEQAIFHSTAYPPKR